MTAMAHWGWRHRLLEDGKASRVIVEARVVYRLLRRAWR